MRILLCRCEEEATQEARRKEYQLHQFKTLHDEDRNQETDRYCVAAAWFRDWEAWVCNKARDPPGHYHKVVTTCLSVSMK